MTDKSYFTPHCANCGWVDTKTLLMDEQVDALPERWRWTCPECGSEHDELVEATDQELLAMVDHQAAVDRETAERQERREDNDDG